MNMYMANIEIAHVSQMVSWLLFDELENGHIKKELLRVWLDRYRQLNLFYAEALYLSAYVKGQISEEACNAHIQDCKLYPQALDDEESVAHCVEEIQSLQHVYEVLSVEIA
jgi:hypothetical protein